MNTAFLPNDRMQLVPVDAQSRALDDPRGEFYLAGGGTVDFRTHLGIIYRWRWLFLSIVGATILIAGAWASLQTPMYKATATLELNPAPAQVVQTAGQQKPEEAVQPDRDFLALQLGLVKSRNVAERVERALGLSRSATFLPRKNPQGDASKAAVDALMDGFSASGTGSDRIMQVSFVHRDPAMAAKVANEFAEQAIDSNFERADAATAHTRQFLRGRLEATRRDLENSERALIDYARQAKIINVVSGEQPTSGDAAGGTLLASNLVALNQQLADAENARIVAQQKYAQASAAAQAARSADSTVQNLQQQRAQLQAQYEQKSQQFKPDYPEMVTLRAQIAGLDKEIAASGTRASTAVVDSLRAEMTAADKREGALKAQISGLESQFLDLNDRGVKYAILKRAVDTNRSMYNALLEQLGVESSSATRTSSIAVVDDAQVPGAPYSPNIPRTLILALLGGLVLGTGGALGANRFLDKITTPEDARGLNLPLLGVIPLAGKNEQLDNLIADARSSIAEAFHAARTALHFSMPGGPPRSILFTSSRPSEGKTSTTIALAADLVSIGYRVVVIDADLRKPALRGDSPGLAAVLAGAANLENSLLPTESDKLWLLPAGRLPPNPTTLLSGRVLPDLIRLLQDDFDIVMIDGPPIMGFADIPLIAAVAEATVVVIESGKTARGVLMDALARVSSTGGVIVGTILNKFDRKNGLSYSGYDYYAYRYDGSEPTRKLIAPATDDLPTQAVASS